MPQITITVNNVPYTVSCDDGQETHVNDLARYVDAKIEQLRGEIGHVGEARLLLLASLMIADELAEAYQHIDKLQSQKTESVPVLKASEVASKIEGLASVIESLGQRLAA